MKKKYDATVKTGKYTDKEGNEKNRYLTIGSVLERDDGTLCVKLEAIPVTFDGWINFYEPRPKADAEEVPAKKPVPAKKSQDLDDEIPF